MPDGSLAAALDRLLRDFVANGRYSEEFVEAVILRR
jgi:hypothetical protein